MKFKEPYMKIQYEAVCAINPRLKVVSIAFDTYVTEQFKREATITCVFRDTNVDDLHAWGRALDIRPWGFTVSQCNEVRDHINKRFPYDDKHYTCVYGDIDPKERHWNHFHLQVRDVTNENTD